MWQPMTLSDLDSVNSIASTIWGADFYESPEVFEQKFKCYPQGCWMYNTDAYIFSHPAVLDSPPGLNELLPKFTPDCYHLHDIALLPRVRGSGIATRIVKQLIKNNPYPCMTLVAVDGTEKYWESFGFTVRSQTAYGQYLWISNRCQQLLQPW